MNSRKEKKDKSKNQRFETKYTLEKHQKVKGWFFEKKNEINKPLSLIKNIERMNKIILEMKISQALKRYYEKHVNNFF